MCGRKWQVGPKMGGKWKVGLEKYVGGENGGRWILKTGGSWEVETLPHPFSIHSMCELLLMTSLST